MAEYKCRNCDNIEEVEVTDTEVTIDGITMTHKVSSDGCSQCGFTHWEDVG